MPILDSVRARDIGLGCGHLPPGPRNSIADVADVRVGHCTLDDGALRTGVTAVLPHAGDPFRDRPVAASAVINGFGASVGLSFLDELGVLETPILLTNTLSVPACAEALIRRAVRANPAIGRNLPTVHPVVCECNDGGISDIQALGVTPAHAEAALDAAAATFATGSVGAGTGMTCFGFKGGVGTASRRVGVDGAEHQLGVLVLANFGRAGDLRLPDGRMLAPPAEARAERGSCIVVIATDLPLEHRQLARVAKRAGVGLAWCGAFWGNGSGDLAIAFTTANRVPFEGGTVRTQLVLAENRIDSVFRACAEATQEAVYDALAGSPPVLGRDGRRRPALRDCLSLTTPAA
ncbi:MAG: P1 family peptidase [Acetobacteraceae bacterium]|nr:P1 family peptidase [Acetobacteraceae bacterium]